VTTLDIEREINTFFRLQSPTVMRGCAKLSRSAGQTRSAHGVPEAARAAQHVVIRPPFYDRDGVDRRLAMMFTRSTRRCGASRR
jgi:hypothetical protein